VLPGDDRRPLHSRQSVYQLLIAQQVVEQQTGCVLATERHQISSFIGVVNHFATHLPDPNVFKGRRFHRRVERELPVERAVRSMTYCAIALSVGCGRGRGRE